MKKKVLWWIGFVIALLTTVVTYCSCSVLALTAGKANSTITTTTTTTTVIDSTTVNFKPNNK